jgi:MFS family permease
VTITGSLLITLGLIICAFSTSYWQILIGYSILVGLGQGLIIPAGFLAINSYFTTKKSQAVGISLAGASLGQMIMPVMVSFLSGFMDFHGTVLICACLSLFGVIGGFLFQPVENHMKKVVIDSEKPKIIDEKPTEKIVLEKEQIGYWRKLLKSMDLQLLKQPVFLNIVFGISIFYMVNINFSMILPFYLKV